jgi:hypothetical protein
MKTGDCGVPVKRRCADIGPHRFLSTSGSYYSPIYTETQDFFHGIFKNFPHNLHASQFFGHFPPFTTGFFSVSTQFRFASPMAQIRPHACILYAGRV